MDEKKFIAFLFRVLLDEHFKTKTAMAKALDLPLRTLRINFQKLDTAKGGSVAFERLVVYCLANEIDVAAIFDRHIGKCVEQKGGSFLCEPCRWTNICGEQSEQLSWAMSRYVFVRSVKQLLFNLYSPDCYSCMWQYDTRNACNPCPYTTVLIRITEIVRQYESQQL